MFKYFNRNSIHFMKNCFLRNKNITNTSVCFMSEKAVNNEEWIALINESKGVRTITLNNPRKRNTLSLEMLQTLRTHIVDSPTLRVIVINSCGPVFSSGHDLKELRSALGKSHHKMIFDECSQLMTSIRSVEVPVICQVNGLAAAAGCQLMSSCDIVIATNNSKFSTPGASFGVFCSTPGIAVSRSANLKTSAYMVLTGNAITAEEALRSGLISRLVSEDNLEKETENIVNAILSKSKSVITIGKQFFYKQINQDLNTAYQNGSQVMTENLCLTDGQEGITAFIEKRHPQWSHSFDKTE